MKRLNRKGFTLIELLTVIVVLSIVIGIAIPVSNKIISNSKHKALGVMVDQAETFISDQLKINKTDPDSVTDGFKESLDNEKDEHGFVSLYSSNPDDRKLIEEMGISPDDVLRVDYMVDEDNIPCVVITEVSADSGLYNSGYWIKADGLAIPNSSNNKFYSKCCDVALMQSLYTSEVE